MRYILYLYLFTALVLSWPGTAALHAQPSTGPATCASARPAITGETRREIESGGRTRSFLLYVPESYDPAAAAPLVLSFHGFASWPAQQMEMSGWNRLADSNGLIAVYPQGTGFPLRWTIGGTFTGADSPDDVAFISDLLDMLADELCIDPARVYATGLSNGGGMAHLLACTLADRITAIGTVAGVYIDPDDGCQPARPLPVISFHGDLDPIVPYDGGNSGRFDFPGVQEWAAAWGARNGCLMTTQLDAVPPDVLSTIYYEECSENVAVILTTIHGGGHTWPGSTLILPPRLVGLTSDAVDASAAMWAFFSESVADR